MELEPLSPYEEKKWDEHKRMLDSQTNRVKIFESPDGGKTVFERYFGETKRRQIKPEPEQINEDDTVPPGYPARVLLKSKCTTLKRIKNLLLCNMAKMNTRYISLKMPLDK